MAKKKRTRRPSKKKSSKNDLVLKIIVSSVIAIAAIVIGIYVIKKLYPDYDSFEEDKFASKYMVRGIDISHHNPILNWHMVVEQNIGFTYIKATEGTSHLDRNYKFNQKLAKENNARVGAYHFYSFGVSGKEQADHFIKTANCKSGDLLPAIDVEHSPANPYSNDPKYIALVIEELKVMENELFEHFGVRPVIYTNQDCYKLYIKGNFPDNPIWMCDLRKEPTDDINWIIWQFSHKGELPGMDEPVDLNYFRYSFDELKKYLLP